MHDICQEYGGLAQWAWKVVGEEVRFTMATQWAETDRNYLCRRLEAESRVYRFEHTDRGHTMVIESDTLNAAPIEGAWARIRFHAHGGSQDEDAIAQWSWANSTRRKAIARVWRRGVGSS